MKRFLLWSIIICLMVSGCSIMGEKGGQTLVGGTWKGKSSDGIEMVMTFKDDMTMTWNMIARGNIEIESSAKYQVDYAAVPVTLDMFDIHLIQSEPGSAPVSSFLAIIKFINGNTIQMCGRAFIRPAEFVSTEGSNLFEMVRESK